MKKITKLLLTNWYYFQFEVIDFDQINFLTGENGAGKSTIIDALQLLFLADTSGKYFNKAANDKSERTLTGYLRCEKGDDGESGIKYERNSRFTSYVACEFFDDVKNSYFTAGFCYDFYSPQEDDRRFFLYDDKMHKDYFLVDETPLDIPSLNKFLIKEYPNNKSFQTSTNKNFKETFYAKLGSLPEKFSNILKKAVPFTPISNIKNFIEEFICDDAINLDTSLMQETINNYKELEKKAENLSVQISDLEKIHNIFEQYSKHNKQEILYNYLIDRSKLENEKEKLDSNEKYIENNSKQIEENEKKQINTEDEVDIKKLQRDKVIAAINDNDINKMIVGIEEQINTYSNKIEYANKYFFDNKKVLVDSYTKWKLCTENIISKNQNSYCNELIDSIKDSSNMSNDILQDCTAEKISSIGGEKLKEIENKKHNTTNMAISLRSRLDEIKEHLTKQLSDNKKELSTLKAGIHSLPNTVERFKTLLQGELQTEYGLEAEVNILAQLLEIKNDRWRNAIEGYLSTQKYYIIVDAKYFKKASIIYNNIKNNYDVHGVGLVNTVEICNAPKNIKQNSLAEEIITENKNARAYIDYLLGNVIKCDNIENITQNATSITDECMLYKGYVLRHLNKKHWEKPAIGRMAIEMNIKRLEKEIELLESQLDELISVCLSLKDLCDNYRCLSENDIMHLDNTAKEYLNISEYKVKLNELQVKIDSIDKSPLTALEDERNSIELKLKQLDNQKSELIKCIERLGNEINSKQNEIAQNQTIIKELKIKIENEYSLDWIEEIGENKFDYEYGRKSSYETIIINFKRQREANNTQKNNSWNELIKEKSSYINIYKESYSIDDKDNKFYEEKLLELKDVKLPEYSEKINNAKKKSYEEFQEDFLSKMKANILNAKSQIDDINRAIKGNFNGDEYKFKAIANKEYKRFYDMFVDDTLEKDYNLFSMDFNNKYKDEINELFDLIVNNTNDEDYKKKIELYTNYKTYLDFDLEVIDKTGYKQRLSKTLKKKSGGETQTPFYIAVLASFAQIYRIGRDKQSNTIRIIIFDEAFSKMDDVRIKESIKLLREFNFQVILSAPSDKIPDIATFVDRNIIVIKDDKVACAKFFDPKDYDAEKHDE